MHGWMMWVYDYLITAMWVAFFVYWQAMAGNVKTTRRLEPLAFRVARSVLFLTAIALLMFNTIPVPWLYKPLYRNSEMNFFVGVAVLALGLLFAVWARMHLGRNWSRSVTIKEGHELVQTGPYGLARHPIYTGILVGFVGTAIAVAQVRGWITVVLVLASLWIKLTLEERWMREVFGTQYDDYARRVRALVPLVL
ncbi:MAG: isoprenylcysteine carboxylmethyltransferase family protein [Terracidiphilus sp.]